MKNEILSNDFRQPFNTVKDPFFWKILNSIKEALDQQYGVPDGRSESPASKYTASKKLFRFNLN